MYKFRGLILSILPIVPYVDLCYNQGVRWKRGLYNSRPQSGDYQEWRDCMSKYTEKSKEYTMNYMKEKLDEIKFRVPKGQKQIIREHAEKRGETLSPFIVRAINETMQRDIEKDGQQGEQ